MSKYELAEMSIARMKAPLDSPQLADFVANLDSVNQLAERSPGYRWRLQTDDGDATALRPFDEATIVNLSTWKDLKSLRDYVFSEGHVAIMRRRREWFEHLREAYLVCWWVPAGHRPTVEEAKQRLEHLRTHGPSEHAFTFKKPFPPPDQVSEPVQPFLDECPAT